MNKENILAVADAIENLSISGLKFDMCVSFYAENCQTVACIAGWAFVLEHGGVEKARKMGLYDVSYQAASWLGIDHTQQMELFRFHGRSIPELDGLDLGDVTSEQAVKVLRHLAESGEVDWSVAK